MTERKDQFLEVLMIQYLWHVLLIAQQSEFL